MKKIIVTALSILVGLSASAQQSDKSSETFKAGGKPTVTIFSDFRYDIHDGKTNPAFEISRAYFGYAYKFSPNFSSKVVFDVTSSGNKNYPSAYSAYVKNAFGEYAKDGLKIDFGLIGTNLFKLQESMWTKRYLLKSFQDLYGYGSSADLGASISYQALPELSFDAQVVNGEGYKKLQSDSAVKVSLGATYEPIKHLYIRVYGDYMKKDVGQTTLNAMLAYKDDNFTVAGEYNYQKNHGMTDKHDLYGVSLWGTYKASKSVAIFARYDNLSSKKINGAADGWNIDNDGSLYAAGVEFFPVKGIAITPNIQLSDPKQSGKKSTTSCLVNFNFSF